MLESTVIVKVEPDVEAFDEWVRSLRLMVSHIGFALDGYLASRPISGDTES